MEASETDTDSADNETDEQQGGDGVYADVEGISTGDDLLLIGDNEASLKMQAALEEPIANFEVLGLTPDSPQGEVALERVDADVTVPEYIYAAEGGFEVRPLEDLVEKYA